MATRRLPRLHRVEGRGPSGVRPPAPIGRWRVAIVAAGSSAFVALAIAAHGAPLFSFDLVISRAFQTVHGAWFERPLAILSAIGFPPVVGIVYGSIIVVILLAGARREAMAAAFATLGA